jgi:cleavage and polyadenylation specificity factor subunit 1
LYSPTSEWEPLPLGKFSLGDSEHVTCLKLVSLPYEGHSSGYREFLAAGTIYCYSEDVNTRGRLLIFDVIETVPEPGKPLTAIKMKAIFDKEQKGPVTCVESVDGYLIGCVGQKVFIWEYTNNELIGKAFIDTNFYVHRMVSLKHFVLIADLHHSVSLVRFQPDYTKLSYAAKVYTKILYIKIFNRYNPIIDYFK